jgi:hypothetical protein
LIVIEIVVADADLLEDGEGTFQVFVDPVDWFGQFED